MPLFLSIVSFFNGVCWTIYALLRFDIFIIVSAYSSLSHASRTDQFGDTGLLHQFSSASRLIKEQTAILNSLTPSQSSLGRGSFIQYASYFKPASMMPLSCPQIPNGLGVLFAVAQLVLHAMYHKSTRRQIEARKSKSEMGLVEVVVMGETSQICKATKNGNHPETQNT